MVILSNYTKPNVSTLSQPLQMAAHALDWGNSLNPRRRGGKQLTMVVIFVSCLVLGDNPNIILFLPYKTYGAGVFVSARTKILVKLLMAADVLCAYPDHNKPFHIFTDASDYQLGTCIMQEGKPVAYHSKKLNSAQMNYTTIDKELLCVVATLREFCSMLLGAELHVHTDHKNILNIGDSSQQQLCWISYVDEYGLELHYVEGPRNVISDTFSRLLRSDVSSPLVGKKAAYVDSNSESGNRNES
jgi:hypothetical protein